VGEAVTKAEVSVEILDLVPESPAALGTRGIAATNIEASTSVPRMTVPSLAFFMMVPLSYPESVGDFEG